MKKNNGALGTRVCNNYLSSTKVDPTYRNIRPIYVIEKIFQKLTSTNW